MRIVFATTMSLSGSTVRGRILPLAQELSDNHEVHLLLLKPQPPARTSACPGRLGCHLVGTEPFSRHTSGKTRLSGLGLVVNMAITAWQTFLALFRLNPDCVVLAKPLPHNTLGVLLWHWFKRLHSSIVLDADDFELSANELRPGLQRTAIHWSERAATAVSDQIIAATPFLNDHFQFLKPGSRVHTIPTGIFPLPVIPAPSGPTPIIGYLGSLARSSGHRIGMLPEIFSQLSQLHPNAKFLIAGQGHDEDFLRQQLRQQQLEEKVVWYGPFTQDDLPALLGQITILVDPVGSSVTERAKSSFRAVLAVAAGRALVTSNVGIRADIVPASFHSRCFASPGDVRDYAHMVGGFIAQPLTEAERGQLRKHGRRFVWPHLARQYGSVLTDNHG